MSVFHEYCKIIIESNGTKVIEVKSKIIMSDITKREGTTNCRVKYETRLGLQCQTLV